ncbi:MAG: hypothetical protein WCK25_00800 [Actinomycetes bacterium]
MSRGLHSRAASLLRSLAQPVLIGSLVTGLIMMSGAQANGTSNFRLIPSPLPTTGLTAVEAVGCTPATVCEVVGTLSSGKTAIYRTANGGVSWGRQNVPSSISDLSAISCPTIERCSAVGGTAENVGVAAVTATSGTIWRSVSLPSGTGHLSGVSCFSALLCTAVGTSKFGKWLVLQSTNGGASWSVRFSSTTSGILTGISCATALFCLAIGYAADNTGAQRVAGITTADGGQTWVPMASLSAKLHEVHAVACHLTVKITTCVLGGLKSSSLGGGIFVSSTLGKSWIDRSPGPRLANATSVSCTSSLNCYLVGATTTGHAASYFTGNSGTSWDPVTVPSTALALQTIGCANAGRCVAFSQPRNASGAPGAYRS